MQPIKIYFDSPKIFEPNAIKQLNGIIGLYLIFTNDTYIQYPFGLSKLIYIGMSEKKTNSIGRRLTGHFDGKSNNVGLMNYRKQNELLFTHINFEVLREKWHFKVEELEGYFINDFVKNYGVYPICNNRTGSERPDNLQLDFEIDWDYFK